MVYVNLGRVLLLIQAIGACPVDIPRRHEKLFEKYEAFKSTTPETISIYVAELERLKEARLDEENLERRKRILKRLVEIISTGEVVLPEKLPETIYLITPLSRCNIGHCNGNLLVSRPDKCVHGRKVVVYTRDKGSTAGEAFSKICTSCKALHHPSFSVYETDKTIRKYPAGKDLKYFAATLDTYFECLLLHNVTEDVVTCNCRLINFVVKYNNLHQESNGPSLYYQRLNEAWFLFIIANRVSLEFKVERKECRHIDIEAICKYLFPTLKTTIDNKWKAHSCDQCATRLVVLDGNMKCWRLVCASRGEKIERHGALNEFTACHESPLANSKYCQHHQKDEAAQVLERMDMGVLTRAKRRELGIHVDVLTSGEDCCRKKEAITVRSCREKTAGLLYAYRSCGVSLGFIEMIHAETCTAFVCLLMDLFGEQPGPELIQGVIIDRACDVHPYIERIGKEGYEACLFYSKLAWMVDPFHCKGHKEDKCVLSSPKCCYHPRLEKHAHLVAGYNSEIAEQSFRKVNKSKDTTRYLTIYTRLVFLKVLDDERNLRMERTGNQDSSEAKTVKKPRIV